MGVGIVAMGVGIVALCAQIAAAQMNNLVVLCGPWQD